MLVHIGMCFYVLVYIGMGTYWYMYVLVQISLYWYVLEVSINSPLIWSMLTLTVGLISPDSDTLTSSCHTADLYTQ